jgi:hypothetical protein
MGALREEAKTRFVNAVGRFSHFNSIVSIVEKLACWLRFSRWCVERGISAGRYDGRARGEYEDRYNLYEAVIQQEALDDETFDFLEFGVFEGTSIDWWTRRISDPRVRFFGFDTFTGLPEQWGIFGPKTFSAEGKTPEISDPRCHFEVGLFQKTVPAFVRKFSRPRRMVVHLDADLYSSTLFALTSLATILRPGDLLFFDEFASPTSEFRALEDFVKAYLVKYELLGAVNNFNRVCLKLSQVMIPVEQGQTTGARQELAKATAQGA